LYASFGFWLMSYQYYTKGYSGTLHSIYQSKVVNDSLSIKVYNVMLGQNLHEKTQDAGKIV